MMAGVSSLRSLVSLAVGTAQAEVVREDVYLAFAHLHHWLLAANAPDLVHQGHQLPFLRGNQLRARNGLICRLVKFIFLKLLLS